MKNEVTAGPTIGDVYDQNCRGSLNPLVGDFSANPHMFLNLLAGLFAGSLGLMAMIADESKSESEPVKSIDDDESEPKAPRFAGFRPRHMPAAIVELLKTERQRDYYVSTADGVVNISVYNNGAFSFFKENSDCKLTSLAQAADVILENERVLSEQKEMSEDGDDGEDY